jgi:hypothetical protein
MKKILAMTTLVAVFGSLAACTPLQGNQLSTRPTIWRIPSDVRVMVVIPESILRRPTPDPAVETVLNNTLDEAGFVVIDPQGQNNLNARDQMLALAKGNGAALTWLKAKFDADVFIGGEAFAEEVTSFNPSDIIPRLPNLGARITSFGARLEVKAYDPSSAGLVMSRSFNGNASGLAASVAGKAALEDAATAAGPSLVEKLRDWDAKRRIRTLRINGLQRPSQVTALINLIQGIPGVREVKQTRFDPAAGTEIEIRFAGSTAALAEALEESCLSSIRNSGNGIDAAATINCL